MRNYCRNQERLEGWLVYTFVNKLTGENIQVRATDAETATLKAWQINTNLTFKVPQPQNT